ncbi:hypothetical protein Pan161_35120 [Gimesia algae]|uniref:Uncharacterized protein n=1 Tax=Gimesia algae TaxID=2527971 RepID=A0A517VFR1_9PLAN|nr:hypothetical protein Pan161_35120 [Gimesia algae]
MAEILSLKQSDPVGTERNDHNDNQRRKLIQVTNTHDTPLLYLTEAGLQTASEPRCRPIFPI